MAYNPFCSMSYDLIYVMPSVTRSTMSMYFISLSREKSVCNHCYSLLLRLDAPFNCMFHLVRLPLIVDKDSQISIEDSRNFYIYTYLFIKLPIQLVDQ